MYESVKIHLHKGDNIMDELTKEELSQKRLFQAESLFDSAIRKCPWSQN